MTRWILLALLAVQVSANGSPTSFPAVEFSFSEGEAPTIGAISEEVRKKILLALCRSDRDDILRAVVPTRMIGDDTWFDVRGLVVRKNELTADANFTRLCLDYARFTGVDLSGAEFNSALLRGAIIEDSSLQHANFDSSHLERADFANCALRGVNFRLATCDGHTVFRDCVLDGARFDYCQDLAGVLFRGGSLRGAMFPQCRLVGAKFVVTDISNASFEGANLSRADFYGTRIDGIDLTDANLTRAKLQAAKLSSSLRLVRTTIFGTYFGDVDISRLDLSYVVWDSDDYRLGEEIAGDDIAAKTAGAVESRERQRMYGKAEVIYWSLAENYRRTGHLAEYLRLRFRSLEMRRKMLALAPNPLENMEYLKLCASRWVYGYGTKPSQLMASFSLMLCAFAALYFLGWKFWKWRGWFRWYVTQPNGAGFIEDDTGAFTEATHIDPAQFHNLEAMRHALRLSLEATFMFVEKIFSVPDMLHFFREEDSRPLPSNSARVLFGIQAMLGILFMVLAGKLIVLLAGG